MSAFLQVMAAHPLLVIGYLFLLGGCVFDACERHMENE